jgi:uncharacterized ferredoxin-like protein
MAVYDESKVTGTETLLEVARLCALAALKAPTVARTKVKTAIVTGDDLWPIVDILEILGEGSAFIKGDAITVRKSLEAGTPPVLLLVGVDTSKGDLAWNCGACGFATCGEFNAYAKDNAGLGTLFGGPSCAWKVLDHAIALNWSAAAAAQYNVDNRIQASTGVGAWLLGYLEGCNLCCGLTMGPAGELVYYNRKSMRDKYTEEDIIAMLQRNVPALFQGFCGDGWPKMRHVPNWFDDLQFSTVGKVPEIEAKAAEIAERVQKYVEQFYAKKQQSGAGKE